ncbi:MAG: CRTAC1 family protein, partial [Verrucomicrobiota bacterium]
SLSPTLFTPNMALVAARHRENNFDDYKVQPLLPNKMSRLGPGLAWADVNGDGWSDLYMGGARGQPGRLLIQNAEGHFFPIPTAAFKPHAGAEDMSALFFDANADGHSDLYVVSGGADVEDAPERLRDRLYLNNGRGSFSDASDRLPDLRISGSVATAADVDRDGDLDLFVGGRFIPGRYPEPPRSTLLLNEQGRFKEGSLPAQPGLVTGAIWSDADDDGWLDLLITTDWGPIRFYRNREGTLEDQTASAGLSHLTGFWNGIAGRDVDNDGDIDYVVTNLGLNTKYSASAKKPMIAYYGDFGAGGRNCFIEAKRDGDSELPIRGRSCSIHAMPQLAERFTTFHQFASSTLADIYSLDKLNEADRLEATTLETGLLINRGGGRFTFKPLPRIVQIAPGFGVVFTDYNADGDADIYLVQNFFSPQPETGRMDGGISQLLTGRGNGTFFPVRADRSGLICPQDGKALTVTDFNRDGWPDLAGSFNNSAIRAFTNAGNTNNAPIVIELTGPKGNPKAIGAKVTIQLDSGRRQTAEVHAGSGYLSQSVAKLFFGRAKSERMKTISVRWPDGRTAEYEPGGDEHHLLLEAF